MLCCWGGVAGVWNRQAATMASSDVLDFPEGDEWVDWSARVHPLEPPPYLPLMLRARDFATRPRLFLKYVLRIFSPARPTP